ncbi:uncharacterized protein UBRO_20535 [Ustilago bromivora]|uniref:Uncharacterized protein n=1 Tax=Ustilago bromivora TaxID=307758 RepID=A0A1K0H8S4_9BASI|nr:uncharacterized protein UBRO_20535 [Ustilago bromivora]
MNSSAAPRDDCYQNTGKASGRVFTLLSLPSCSRSASSMQSTQITRRARRTLVPMTDLLSLTLPACLSHDDSVHLQGSQLWSIQSNMHVHFSLQVSPLCQTGPLTQHRSNGSKYGTGTRAIAFFPPKCYPMYSYSCISECGLLKNQGRNTVCRLQQAQR